MTHWLDPIADIFDAPASAGLKDLARLASPDPKNFYVGANLSGVDVRSCDLTGLSFANASFSGMKINGRTISDCPHLSAAYLIRGKPQPGSYLDVWETLFQSEKFALGDFTLKRDALLTLRDISLCASSNIREIVNIGKILRINLDVVSLTSEGVVTFAGDKLDMRFSVRSKKHAIPGAFRVGELIDGLGMIRNVDGGSEAIVRATTEACVEGEAMRVARRASVGT